MAKKTETASDGLGTADAEGWLSGIVADEDDLDRPSLWRLGAWGLAAVGALVVGLMSAQLPVNAQRTLLAEGEIAGHARKVEMAVQTSSLETRRLSAAVETLSGDRDRLFTRLSALEQGLDTVTGSIGKSDERPASASWPAASTAPVLNPAAAISAQQPAPATAVTPAVMTPAAAETPPAADVERTETVAARAEPQAVDALPAIPSVIEAAPIPAVQAATESNAQPAADAPAARTDFGIDLGGAHSIDGLRALWRGVSVAHKSQFEGLRPVIAVQERKTGLGVQLRLIAGPIKDAAAAARICAALANANRECKTSAFEGQRLSLPGKPAETSPTPRKPKPKAAQTQPAPPPAQPERTFSLFGSGNS